jgi:hypothetical protein
MKKTSKSSPIRFKTLKDLKSGKIQYIYNDNKKYKQFFLGEGAFGLVFKGFKYDPTLKNKQGTAYAIKKIPYSALESEEDSKIIKNEVSAFLKLN